MNVRCTLLVLLFAAASCGDDRQAVSDSSDSAVDAARNFVQAALVGDFDRASKFMVNDSLNNEDLNTVRRLNERLSKEEKDRYQEASIRIHQDRKVNDSTEVVYYSNSFKNKIDSLKVIREKDEWKVDFKFMFHKTDSIP